MIFYITKYALTKGIIEIDTNTLREYSINDGMLTIRENNIGFPTFYSAGEWYTDKSFAIADAEYRRTKKLESLKKQIKKLEKIEFK